MAVFVSDTDAFDKLATLEGAAWQQLQQAHPEMREGFFHVRDAYCSVICQAKEWDEDLTTFRVTELMDNNVIYGEAGYARYVVRDNGEIVLDGRSTRPERAQKARAAGFRVI